MILHNIAHQMSFIIAHNTLKKGKKNVTDEMVREGAQNVRKSDAFKYLQKECDKSWKDLVKYGMDACKGSGSELMLDLAGINLRIKSERSTAKDDQLKHDKIINKSMGNKK